MRLLSAVLFFLPFLTPAARAEVRLPRILSSHMVLQRERPIHLWGWSDPGEAVTISLASTTRATKADQLGRWSVYFPPLPAGGPFTLTFQAANRITLDDVLIGDVWFASGQSNMEMPLKGFPGSASIKNSAEEIRGATDDHIRLLLVDRKASPVPLSDFASGPAWAVCSPETAAGFSAVAYFFGREIRAAQNVPIGLIDSTWGGTPAESWASLEGIAADASLMPVFAARAHMVNEQTDIELIKAAEKRQDEEARRNAQTPPKHVWRPDQSSWEPSWLYNAMVAPAIPFAMKGVIWYQGESNTGPERAGTYAKLFPALISDWRAHWAQGDFPFLFVQISSFRANPPSDFPLVREAQRRTLSLVKTGMAVTIDVGDAENVHPADKQTVGKRLALAARALAYGENVEYSGPAYRQASVEGNSLRLWFDHVSGGLVVHGNTLAGFELAGSDGKFLPASAHIDGTTILVDSPQVSTPKYVRYAWKDVPDASLFNGAGLPASPFTSEE